MICPTRRRLHRTASLCALSWPSLCVEPHQRALGLAWNNSTSKLPSPSRLPTPGVGAPVQQRHHFHRGIRAGASDGGNPFHHNSSTAQLPDGAGSWTLAASHGGVALRPAARGPARTDQLVLPREAGPAPRRRRTPQSHHRRSGPLRPHLRLRGSYDSVLVSEYNIGAMENPGCVIFNEDYYLYRGPTTRMPGPKRKPPSLMTPGWPSRPGARSGPMRGLPSRDHPSDHCYRGRRRGCAPDL